MYAVLLCGRSCGGPRDKAEDFLLCILSLERELQAARENNVNYLMTAFVVQ